MDAILHDGDELSIAELSVAVFIEDEEHSVDKMAAEAGAGADLDGAVELIWQQGAATLEHLT